MSNIAHVCVSKHEAGPDSPVITYEHSQHSLPPEPCGSPSGTILKTALARTGIFSQIRVMPPIDN